MARAVLGWFLLTSLAAGLVAVVLTSVLFGIPLTGGAKGIWAQASPAFSSFQFSSGSLPLMAILLGVFLGVVGASHSPTFQLLNRPSSWLEKVGARFRILVIPFVLSLGISLGINLGTESGLTHYLSAVALSALLCGCWFTAYLILLRKTLGPPSTKRIFTEYFLPTAAFAAGSCSSLATLPANLGYAKKAGVGEEVAEFVIPFGAVVNMDASVLINVAFGPLVFTSIFGIELSWATLLSAMPAVVLFTIAAPGLPAAAGALLWTPTFFSDLLGLDPSVKAHVVATWVALGGGFVDMMVTAGNCTGDGFTAFLFDKSAGKANHGP